MSTLRTLFRGENRYDILGLGRPIALASAALVVLCLGSLAIRGLNLGIEFEGGIVWELPARDADTDDIESTLAGFDLADARIQEIRDDDGPRVRIRGESDDIGRQAEVTEALAGLVGIETNEVSVTEVGPSWGDEITSKAQRALIIFLIVIFIYIAFRFELKMAAAAMVALLHDVLLSVGVYSIFQLEVTPATVVAFLTIMGYSLYDTVVVFDKVRENTQSLPNRGRTTYRDVVNLSLNQVLMRSINTSITSVLPVVSMLFVGSFLLGATALQEFAVALLVGILAGTYSSIFVAAQVLVPLKEREPEWEARTRVADASGGSDVRDAEAAVAASAYTRTQAPRPRKQGRKR